MQQRSMADFICIALIIIVYDGEKTLFVQFWSQTFSVRSCTTERVSDRREGGQKSGGDLSRLSQSQRTLR